MDTIFAQATAPGKAGVSVIRISGPDAFVGVSRLCALPDVRRTGLRTIRDLSGDLLDTGLVLTFEAGASFTGEPVVELQLHGSTAVVAAVETALSQISGFRPAEAGEFTRRALDNAQLDLVQVEALADLIDAETDLQRRQAQSVLNGALSTAVLEWRRDLIEAAALVEASLDFADEDVPVDVSGDVLDRVSRVRTALEYQISGYGAAERVRDGFEVAIIGPPNAGKSTLLNAIAQRPAALTSEIAGTTRDVIEVRINLGGLPVTLLDTAGLRKTTDPLESAGISLALERARAADLRVWLGDTGTDPGIDVDLSRQPKDDADQFGGISGKTGAGIGDLLDEITTLLRQRIPSGRFAIRQRHLNAMNQAVDQLGLFGELARIGQIDERAAEHLRLAARYLAELIGVVDVDDLLDHIFSSFCIGK